MKLLINSFPASRLAGLLTVTIILTIPYSCSNSSAAPTMPQQVTALPVMTVDTMDATSYQTFPATLEGKVNVEIRPQVDGYIEKIFVDEGAWVKAGQPLFKINDRPFSEQLANARARLAAAQANLQKAQLEVDRLSPLVKNNVIADVQLKSAGSAYEEAKAAVAQAQANVGTARINLGYTTITAPVSGYIGRLPYKTGALVGRGESQPLTVLSDVSEIYAYFSMSEVDFLAFRNHFAGNSLDEKIRKIPPVELLQAENTVYPQKGKVGIVEGQFDKTMGAISFRATFPNAGGILRSGNTGRIRIPQKVRAAILVPQEATFEIQDKVFVFALEDSNKVASRPITVSGKTPNYYFVSNGIRPGEKIVLTGTGNLKDGMVIAPQPMSRDSLLKARPL